MAEANIHFLCSWAWLAPHGWWLWATQEGALDLLPPHVSSPECPPKLLEAADFLRLEASHQPMVISAARC